MKTQTKVIIVLSALALIVVAMFGMYFLGNINGKTEIRTSLTVNEQSAYEVAKLATWEVTGTNHYEYSNRVTEEGGFFQKAIGILENITTERTITVDGFFIASYGVVLDSNASYVQPNVSANEIYITLPEPQLLYYVTPDDTIHPVKVTEQNGLAVLERNEVTGKARMNWYMQGHAAAANSTKDIDAAKQGVQKAFSVLYEKALGKKVFVKFEKDFKGYKKLSPQDI